MVMMFGEGRVASFKLKVARENPESEPPFAT